MPQAAAVVLADNVPTNHTFNPIVTGGKAVFETSEMHIGAAEKQMIWTLDRASARRPTDRVSARLNVPFEQVVEGTYSVRSIARHIGETVVPSDCTSTERTMLAYLVGAMWTNAILRGYTSSRDPVY